jgi:hypothetical protein
MPSGFNRAQQVCDFRAAFPVELLRTCNKARGQPAVRPYERKCAVGGPGGVRLFCYSVAFAQHLSITISNLR